MFHHESNDRKVFLRKDRQSKDSLYPLYARITFTRRKTEFKTEYCLKESDWEEASQKCTGKKKNEINENLTFIHNEILKVKREFDYQDKPYDVNTIKDVFLGVKKLKIGIVEYFNEVIARKTKLSNVYKKATILKYEGAVNYLKRFLLDNFQKEDLNIVFS